MKLKSGKQLSEKYLVKANESLVVMNIRNYVKYERIGGMDGKDGIG